jgi:NADH-quinone oxidoreductase subunit N
VNFYQLVDNLIHDTLGTSLAAFRPELVLCATIVLILVAKTIDPGRKVNALYLMLVGTAVALWFAAPWRYLGAGAEPLSDGQGPVQIFTGMLVYDKFAVYMRSLLLVFALLYTVLLRLSGVPNRDDATEFSVLVLSATLGMCLMVSANHMMMVFLGVEMASVPSYVLAGMLKHRRRSSEAALKFAVYGGGTAGVMLYGISLLAGVLGSVHLPTMGVRLAEVLASGATDSYLVLVLGGLMVMVGLSFKLSAVPFHFWAPDVFEGAAAEVGAFLSIASKAAALALLVRLSLGLGYVPDLADRAAAVPPSGIVSSNQNAATAMSFLDSSKFQSASAVGWRYAPAINRDLEPARKYIGGLVFLLAAITCTFGNLAAYGQTNIKRLLAYSTIAHAGYMMMAVAAAMALAGSDPAGARTAIAALAFYIGIYLFMNLAAFSTVAFLRNSLGSEEIADYAGLVRRSPGLAICLAITLFSLVGLPPLAGFAAKFTIFAALLKANLLGLLVIGAINTVLSLFYYLRVVKVMVLEAEPSERMAASMPITLASGPGMYCLVITVPIVVFGLWWGLLSWAETAAAGLF